MIFNRTLMIASITGLSVIGLALKSHGMRYLLDKVSTVLNRASNFIWKGVRATVHLIEAAYEKGIKICGKKRAEMEQHLHRSERLPFYDITIRQ